MAEDPIKILLGGLLSLIAVIALFLLFDVFKAFRSKSAAKNLKTKKNNRTKSDSVPATVIDCEEGSQNQVLEEYGSAVQECLVIVLSSETKAVGVCAFLSDRTVEYFVENLPDCCRKNSPAKDNRLRSVMAAVSHWCKKWCYAEAVSLLCQDRGLVKAFNKSQTMPNRILRQFEEKFEFKTFPQWTDNFNCDNMADEELWESMIILAKKLLQENISEQQLNQAWQRFPLEHWERKRTKPNLEQFHQVPHPGQIDKLVNECVTQDLIALG